MPGPLKTALVCAVTALSVTAARAAEVKVLSAGAVEPGLIAAVNLYARRSGNTVAVDIATGPQILDRVSKGETADLVIAPEAVLTTLAGAGKLGAAPFRLGRVGISLAVREGARRPDFSTVAAVKTAVLGAKTVVFSRGTGGTYVAGMMDKLGVGASIAERTERVENGAAIVARLQKGSGDEIGLGATTELSAGVDHGVVIVAPLPAELQNYTAYAAAPFPAAKPETAGFIALLRGSKGKAILARNGVK
jgi:molybdate transport system substrate-binding protein